ncbi:MULTISPECIES: YceI family protein [Undibacterium]|nr:MULTISPECIES: YceI family protein [Undibacterium]
MNFQMKNFLRLSSATLLSITTGLVFAGSLKLDNAKSSLQITFKQMEVPVQASFKRYAVIIDLNEKQIEQSKAQVEIDMNSLELPAPEYNKEVQKKEWFNAAQFPKATFTSTAMKLIAPGKLQVSGNLTIKGKVVATSFPLSYKADGTGQLFEGSLPIKRLAFGIGDGEWKDTSMVADEVVIKFKVVTTK